MNSEGVISISDTFLETIPRTHSSAVASTLSKLRTNPELPGLHVERIEQAKDDRIRSIRVTRGIRILAFRLTRGGQDFWVIEGVYDHEKTYRKARELYLRVNPISGAFEFRKDDEALGRDASGGYSYSEMKRDAEALAAERIAEFQEQQAAEQTEPAAPAEPEETTEAAPAGPALSVSAQDLIEQLGIDTTLAAQAAGADETALVDLAAAAPTWQGMALLDLATGRTLEEVRQTYFTTVSGGSELGTPSTTEDLVGSLTSAQSGATIRLIEDNDELERVLASGDFSEWRVFLHPEQQTFVDIDSRGPYRLTGGAGTGKSVILVHRAARLARRNPEARVVLTTYTRNLADSLQDQVRTLDPTLRRAKALGDEGIHVTGVDRIATTVLKSVRGIEQVGPSVLGWETASPQLSRPAKDWKEAVEAAAASGAVRDATQPYLSQAFLEDEYREIVLPRRALTEADYLRAPRTGRGTRLGRQQRREVWAAVQAYRDGGRRGNIIDWDETSALAAAALDREAQENGRRRADHVLVDEGQDLRPTQWQMLRALVAEGPDDMFIAEDSHQRIYSNPVKLGRYGIGIRGRSRRLRLNYRTTAENLGFAVSVLQGGDFDIAAMEEDGEGASTRGTFRSARSGPEVTFLRGSSLTDELSQVAELLRTWIAETEASEKESPGTIGLLTRWGFDRDRLVRAMEERGITVLSVDRNSPRSADVPQVMTFHRSKGTEFTRVILFGVDKDTVRKVTTRDAYDDQVREAAELRERSLLYVGATRAREQLAVSWNQEPSPLIDGV